MVTQLPGCPVYQLKYRSQVTGLKKKKETIARKDNGGKDRFPYHSLS
jgi:hypothetical protein